MQTTVFVTIYRDKSRKFDFFVVVSEKIGCSVEHDALVKEFMHGFMHENALNPMIYPSLR